MPPVPPYSVELDSASLSPGLPTLPWLGPPAVAESHAWPMLSLAGTPSIELPEHVVNAVRDVTGRAGYPGTTGARPLRVAIAERLSDELARPVDPDAEVLLTVGSMQALHLAAAALCRGMSPALAPAPSFFYKDIVAAAGGRCDWVGGDDGPPDWPGLRAAVAAGAPSAVFVCTPVNPTGYVFTEADLDALVGAVAGSVAWIVSDEAYNGYLHDGLRHISPASVPELAERTVLIRSFSKTYALGAWRVGYAAGPAPVISAMAKLLQYSVLGVPTVAQAAALAALTGPQEWVGELRAGIADRRAPVCAAVARTGLLTTDLPQAGTTLWAAIVDPSLAETDVSRILGRSLGVPAVPGALFGARSPHVRIPFAGALEQTAVLIERLDRFAADLNERTLTR